MKIPAHLKHKPIIQVENYDRLDGPYADNTDAMGLSVGIAQWNGPGWTELSAKVWRNTGEKWSRQSEELPLHRVIDLATLICITMDYSKNSRLSSSDDFPVTRSADNADLTHHIGLMKKELKENHKNLDKSLQRLSLELKRLGY
ncbi:DUF6530 family protein [Pectobacterium aroidearum]|uniref:DUF6530 family protein n=1 Tax=Pectobacterium aroidearum TaxID=1201031 RepID=UPI002113D57B|nr:DUF6530 family protein [Pectobacterium aroidearum]UUE46351.1 DUF6530 family protein [Pectobacterium aroidearum]UUE50572.1 DUF6530 family protein [Pectobacterium aroidearum]UUE54777.1 DUF6530 family protein [Pectobacterium aroidearum]UUE63185.1 DUF6530 family protein [Pectobacterium aroidearum]UUE67410.1 DUF6530 family protein [Pectobacterium aroidearum]